MLLASWSSRFQTKQHKWCSEGMSQNLREEVPGSVTSRLWIRSRFQASSHTQSCSWVLVDKSHQQNNRLWELEEQNVCGTHLGYTPTVRNASSKSEPTGSGKGRGLVMTPCSPSLVLQVRGSNAQSSTCFSRISSYPPLKMQPNTSLKAHPVPSCPIYSLSHDHMPPVPGPRFLAVGLPTLRSFKAQSKGSSPG